MAKETGNRSGLEDDWKGERLLKVKPDKTSAKSIAMNLSHARRRALGVPPPARQSHDRLCAFLKPKKD